MLGVAALNPAPTASTPFSKPGSKSRLWTPKIGCTQNHESETSRGDRQGSRFAWPWLGSKISGSPANIERARSIAAAPASAEMAGVAAKSLGATSRLPFAHVSAASPTTAGPFIADGWAVTFALSCNRAPMRTAYPAPSSASPAARTRIRPTDAPHQRRSTLTRSSDAIKTSFLRSSFSIFFVPIIFPQIFSQIVFRQIVFVRSFLVRSVENLEMAHRSTEPRSGEPDRGLLSSKLAEKIK